MYFTYQFVLLYEVRQKDVALWSVLRVHEAESLEILFFNLCVEVILQMSC